MPTEFIGDSNGTDTRVDGSDATFALGRFVVNADGVAMLRGPHQGMQFGFVYMGALFDVHVGGTKDHPRMEFLADLGPVPYSFESCDVRRSVIAKLYDSRHKSSNHCLNLSPHQHLLLRGRMDLDGYATPVSLVAAAAVFALKVKPELLEIGAILSPLTVAGLPAKGN